MTRTFTFINNKRTASRSITSTILHLPQVQTAPKSIIMPRDGSGASDNAVEAGHDIVHGAGAIKVRRTRCSSSLTPNTNILPKDPHVDRADKTAPMPEIEKGLAIDGKDASGGQSQGLAKGDNAGQGGRSN
ncbi:hypothetical protein Brms1b_009635 [Colletotrichum noveboracense]|nr:hypothetical protein Brms1b_009635 [Colletotrichum noveboracense]